MLTEKRVQVEVSVPLTEELAERRGVKLAQKERELREMKARIKDTTKNLRKGRDMLQDEIDELSKEIETKTMKLTVDAVERPIFDTNEIITVRADTGETLSRRPMSGEERQIEIDVDADVEPSEPAKIIKLDRGRKKKEPSN